MRHALELSRIASVLNSPMSTMTDVDRAGSEMDSIMALAPQFDGDIQFVSIRSNKSRLCFYFTLYGEKYTAIGLIKMNKIELNVYGPKSNDGMRHVILKWLLA